MAVTPKPKSWIISECFDYQFRSSGVIGDKDRVEVLSIRPARIGVCDFVPELPG